MNKSVKLLLRTALSALLLTVGFASYAYQDNISASGQASPNAYVLGDAFSGSNQGFLVSFTEQITSGIDKVFTDGNVLVSNSAATKSLNLQLSDEQLRNGAHYCIYSVNGTLLERQAISTSDATVNYGKYLTNRYIIVTVNTNAGVLATYKLTK